jgi:hypothetical protein
MCLARSVVVEPNFRLIVIGPDDQGKRIRVAPSKPVFPYMLRRFGMANGTEGCNPTLEAQLASACRMQNVDV